MNEHLMRNRFSLLKNCSAFFLIRILKFIKTDSHNEIRDIVLSCTSIMFQLVLQVVLTQKIIKESDLRWVECATKKLSLVTLQAPGISNIHDKPEPMISIKDF